MRVVLEMSPDQRRIEVRPRTTEVKDAMDGVTGRRLPRNGPWSVPAEWTAARELRAVFGTSLHLAPSVRAWGTTEKARLDRLQSLSGQSSGVSSNFSESDGWRNLTARAPDLALAMFLGPIATTIPRDRWADSVGSGEHSESFQVSDIMYMIESDAPLNANHMGLGKTPETIAAIVGSGLDDGLVLVVAPVSAAEGTWPSELATWLPKANVWVARGSAAARRKTYAEAIENGQGWLIVNPAQLMVRRSAHPCERHQDMKKGLSDYAVETMKRCDECDYKESPANPELLGVEFAALVFDEAHEHGVLGGFKTQTGVGTRRLCLRKGGKRILLSGTPMGGQPVKLFHVLQFLRPDVFTSKWRFAEQYLEIIRKTIGYRNVQTFTSIGGIKRCPAHEGTAVRPRSGECEGCDERERAMFDALSPYMLRRTKSEVLADLPPKMYNDIWVDLDGKHADQYDAFDADAYIEEDGVAIMATNVISEYTKLTQMSWGVWDIKGGFKPTTDSPKLRMLEEKLTELGIFDKDESTQAVIFTQFKTVANLVADYLANKGAAVGRLTGDVRGEERAALKEAFQGEGGLRVLVVTTQAGGTSLTLDRASDVFFLDRHWNPDKDEQAEDRCHRASRIHQVTIHRIGVRGTIDEYRAETSDSKMDTNRRVMDLRRYINNEEREEDD
jgi:SNF2 family DNA or RNA helicase